MIKDVKYFTNGLKASVPLVVYTLNNMDSSKKDYPVVIFLSGSGEFSDSNTDIKVANNSNHANLLKFADQRGFLVVAPQFVRSQNYIMENGVAKQTWHPNFQGGYYMRDVINWVKANLPIDPKRIYLTGLSAGGNGTWDTIIKFKDLTDEIAAAIPICGGYQDGDWSLPAKSNVPVWAFHGLKDGINGQGTPPGATQQQVDKLNSTYKISPTAKITLYPDMGHSIWATVYNTSALYDWMLAQKNDIIVTPPVDPPVKQIEEELTLSVLLKDVKVSVKITTYTDKSSTVEKVD